MLFIVGLGLWDEKDVTVRGLETIRKCSKVYLEAYTSVLLCDTARLEELYGKAVVVADREMVESGIDAVLEEAKHVDVAFLVVGDPFGATTHADLVLRARQEGVAVQIIHNASIMNAVGACGLQLYRFGEAVSIPFFTDTWRPDSFYDRIKRNRSNNTHTLCLLDIKVKEPNLEALAQGKIRYEPPRYMTVNTAIAQLLEIEEQRKEQAYSPASLCVGVARLGSSLQAMVAGRMDELARVDFGAPLHSLVIAADDLHEVEREYLDTLRVTADTPRLTEESGVADSEGNGDEAF